MAERDSPAFLALVQATAGATAGVFAAFVLMPLEVVKTRIQLSQTGDASLGGTMARIIKDEGPFAIFRGVTSKCAETGSKNFVYFYIYDALSSSAKGRQLHMTTFLKLALGYTAGVCNTLLTMPLEVISTRCQASTDSIGTLAMGRKLVLQEGMQSLYKGLGFNVLLCINPAIQNAVFDKLKAALLRRAKAQAGGTAVALTSLEAFVLGALAKAVATLITFPLVRVKTMLQAGTIPAGGKGSPRARRRDVSPALTPRKKLSESAADLKEQLVDASFKADKEEHLHGAIERIAQLYRGVTSALTKSVLQAALLYMTKEMVEDVVVDFFKMSKRLPLLLRRQSGKPKLGAFSGRPLPSDQ